MTEKSDGLLGTFLYALVGFISPELMKAAKAMVAGVPKNHWLRSEGTARFTGIARELIEKFSGRFGDVGKAIGAAFGDFLEYAGTDLYGDEDEKKADIKKAAQDWMDEFFRDAGERLKKEPNRAMRVRLSREIKNEFEFRCELLKIIEAARKAVEPPKEAEGPEEPIEPIDWKALNAKFKAVIGTLADDAVSAAKWVDKRFKPVDDWLGKQRGAQTGKLW